MCERIIRVYFGGFINNHDLVKEGESWSGTDKVILAQKLYYT